ncbi:DNA cytosine methyltransferase (plasmid) [Paenibacillus rhizovicinus]|uniref:DNA cytosine methyltransferase n=1 Tax=Paenibacillus rhizovicinus TaxID=2704463 RepID=A0A6C0PAD5_9BACL|nr:DNA cytosine methyltransferase [Paenibacillus rhizovicinus]QHW35488.1 DNA cytosine methyltransferase [Paenibacillus rhizovicinus]
MHTAARLIQDYNEQVESGRRYYAFPSGFNAKILGSNDFAPIVLQAMEDQLRHPEWVPGADLFVQVNEDDRSIIIQNKAIDGADNVHEISVAHRMNRTSGQPRPLVDTCGDRYSTILCIQEKIEISVYHNGDFSQVVVRPLRFKLFEPESFDAADDERIRLLSICAGAGIGSACFQDTNYYSATMEVEIEEDYSAEVLHHNFPHSYLFLGDLRDCHTVAKADVAFVSLDCCEHSTIGDYDQGYFRNLVLGTYKILKSAEPRVLFFENVPGFYESGTYKDLRELLSNDYPYIVDPIQLQSHDFSSIALRDRTYAVYFQEKADFDLFRIPKPPIVRHKKLKEFLDPRSTVHVWKSLDSWMDSFARKRRTIMPGQTEVWKKRSLTRMLLYCNAFLVGTGATLLVTPTF